MTWRLGTKQASALLWVQKRVAATVSTWGNKKSEHQFEQEPVQLCSKNKESKIKHMQSQFAHSAPTGFSHTQTEIRWLVIAVTFLDAEKRPEIKGEQVFLESMSNCQLLSYYNLRRAHCFPCNFIHHSLQSYSTLWFLFSLGPCCGFTAAWVAYSYLHLWAILIADVNTLMTHVSV